MSMPIHPISKTALIPVIRTHPDGRQQRYWISLKKFMEDRDAGVSMSRIPRKEHKDVAVPEQKAPEYQIEFIENLEDFGVAGLDIEGNRYEVELISKIEIRKNGKLVKTYPVKVDIEKVAVATLKKMMGLI